MSYSDAKQHLARLSVVLLAATLLGGCMSGVATVERLTIVNRTSYDLEVRVRGGGGGGWALLGRVDSRARTVVEQVEDFGESWIFQFRYGSELAGDLRVRRDELASDRWVVEVPEEVVERLRSEGIMPSERPA
jgi:hypothetical protein